MGRYDKIRVYNGSAWVQPGRMYVYTGTAWEDFGTNTSFNTEDMYVRNSANTAWVRQTLNRVDTPVYNTAVQALSKSSTGLAGTLSQTYGTTKISVNRYASSWNAGIGGVLDTLSDWWWAGIETNNDGKLDSILIEWTNGARWVEKLRLKAPPTAYYQAVPTRLDVQFRLADGTWTALTAYYATSPTASNGWGGYFTFNYKVAQGCTAIRINAYNNSNYKPVAQSTRIGEIDLHLGTIGTSTDYV